MFSYSQEFPLLYPEAGLRRIFREQHNIIQTRYVGHLCSIVSAGIL
jgi:hypothetical protein